LRPGLEAVSLRRRRKIQKESSLATLRHGADFQGLSNRVLIARRRF
jgi:hypothetical protein